MVTLKEYKNYYIGNIYSWGDWEQGWMGKVVVVDIDKKHIYLQSVYKEKDITFIKDKVKPIEKEWFINTGTPIKLTHKEFEKDLIKKYTFIEKVNL
jgi:hypothetical protein